MNYELKIKNKKKKAGFMAIEILLATSIITMIVLAGTAVAQKSIIVSRQAVHSLQATYLLEEGAEALKIIRDNDWNNFSYLSALCDNPATVYLEFLEGTWNLTSTSEPNIGIFNRVIIYNIAGRDDITGDLVQNCGPFNDGGSYFFNVSVRWMEGGKIINKELSFYLMDIWN